MTSSYRQKATFSGKFKVSAPELAKILTYPRYSEQVHQLRVRELASLGVVSLLPGGNTMIGGVSIAGKGCVGLVIKAIADGKLCALKIRRTDANRSSMEGEVRLHRIANNVSVGPRLFGCSDNFVLMEFVEGPSIADWAEGDIDAERARKVTRSVLEQCYRLDKAGLDHGQLSRLDRHVIVSGSAPTIIDFESASTARKTANVSAAGQSLFVSGPIASRINKSLGRQDREIAINLLKTYKRNQTKASFDSLLETLVG